VVYIGSKNMNVTNWLRVWFSGGFCKHKDEYSGYEPPPPKATNFLTSWETTSCLNMIL
jgi:hypothetical protein